MPEKVSASEAMVRLLARREHSAFELKQKLSQKGYAMSDIEDSLCHLQQHNLQSDERYAASLLRSKAQQNYGPYYIRQLLQQKKVEEHIIEQVMADEAIDWLDIAQNLWKKKASIHSTLDFAQKQKIKRFLLYRGFTSDMIQQLTI